MSILYKYHISRDGIGCWYIRANVSILYKYHISRDGIGCWYIRANVSILYKYHISLTKNSKNFDKEVDVSILYKYHISQEIVMVNENSFYSVDPL